MRKLIPLLFCVAATVFAIPTSPPGKEIEGRKPQQFFSCKFDRPGWSVAHYDHSEDTLVFEWTNQEPVTNWTELITGNIYFIDTEKVSAQRYAGYFVDQIRPGSIDFKVNAIIDTPDDVVLEWSHKGSGKWPAQKEIVHFFRGRDAIYRLAYTVVETAFDKKKYEVWLGNIRDAKLVDIERSDDSSEQSNNTRNKAHIELPLVITTTDLNEADFVKDALNQDSQLKGTFDVDPGSKTTTVHFKTPLKPANELTTRTYMRQLKETLTTQRGRTANTIRFVFPEVTLEE